jgi:hypothetical protein
MFSFTHRQRDILADAFRSAAKENDDPRTIDGRTLRPSEVAQEIEAGTRTGLRILKSVVTVADGPIFEEVAKGIAKATAHGMPSPNLS